MTGPIDGVWSETNLGVQVMRVIRHEVWVRRGETQTVLNISENGVTCGYYRMPNATADRLAKLLTGEIKA